MSKIPFVMLHSSIRVPEEDSLAANLLLEDLVVYHPKWSVLIHNPVMLLLFPPWHFKRPMDLDDTTVAAVAPTATCHNNIDVRVKQLPLAATITTTTTTATT